MAKVHTYLINGLHKRYHKKRDVRMFLDEDIYQRLHFQAVERRRQNLPYSFNHVLRDLMEDAGWLRKTSYNLSEFNDKDE